MQAEILIVWPDAEAAEALGTAIGEAGVDARIRTLDALPEWGELWARLEAAQGRIRTVVVGMGADERAEQILRELSQVSLPVAPVAAARGLDARLVRLSFSRIRLTAATCARASVAWSLRSDPKSRAND